MAIGIMERYFGIQPDKQIQSGSKTGYLKQDTLYSIVDVTHLEQEALLELYEMSEHMAKNGDYKVSLFVANQEGKYLVTHEERDYVLLSNQFRPRKKKKNKGAQLARFHTRGSGIEKEFSAMSRLGQWKDFWGRRLEQLEQVRGALIQEQRKETFEQLFIGSLPYYLGLCENAIQYIVDTELDEEKTAFDGGTICHERFHQGTWGEWNMRNPFDWVFDHQGRDIAEWIRARYFSGNRTIKGDLDDFVQGYTSVVGISPYCWRMVYGRLLFPLHYFELVEGYFQTTSLGKQKQLEGKLERYLRDTGEHEEFLRHFYQMVNAPVNHLPTVEWL